MSQQLIPVGDLRLLAARINREHKKAEDGAKGAIECAIVCGNLLADAKAQVPHGKWMPWVEKHFSGSHRTANGYIRLASNSQALANLDGGIEASLKALTGVKTEKKTDPDGPLMTSETDEWYTPEHVWRAALDAMHLNAFDLDPCADAGKGVVADNYYTREDDGLTKPWHGAVWMNPPYSDIKTWVTYLQQECGEGRCTDFAALVPVRTDTQWWEILTTGHDQTVVFVRGRLKFGNAKNSAPFPSALVFGCTDPDDIQASFTSIGRTARYF